MNFLGRSTSSSLTSVVAAARNRCYGYLPASSRLSGSLDRSQGASSCSDNFQGKLVGNNWRSSAFSEPSPGATRVKANLFSVRFLSFRSFTDPSSQDITNAGRSSRSMDFIKGIIAEDGKDPIVGSHFPRHNVEHNADVVHIKLMRNNTFVTVTDSKGNTKLKASAGRLEEMKGGPKLSRYAAEATAEFVGREARKLGLKSVVMRVRGFTYFKKKRQAIMSWREGFTDSRSDKNPVVYIEDTTRRPHNGCRLPKKRRI